MDYARRLEELDDRKLREEYDRAKDRLFRGFRYGLGSKSEAEMKAEIAALEAELLRRRRT